MLWLNDSCRSGECVMHQRKAESGFELNSNSAPLGGLQLKETGSQEPTAT